MPRLILLLYRALIFVAVWPLCLAARNHPNFKGTLRQRLAWTLSPVPRGDLVWFHGASLGEVKALAGPIAAVRTRRPRVVICLSAMTAAGRQAAAGLDGVDLILPMPFDAGWIMRRMLRHLAPRALVIAETEIWPNMLVAARAAGIPVALVNARLTPRSFARYRLVKRFVARLLENVRILATADDNAGRFRALGATDVRVTGNVKFDAVSGLHPERIQALRESLGAGARPVFVAGSIREGEERAVMEAVAAARREVPDLFCIVAPRHQDRIPCIVDEARRHGIAWARRSAPDGRADLLILDTMGELFDLYGVARAAFVGGSLVDLGGQNILEPIAWGVPTLHGPHMGNFLWALAVVHDYTYEVADAAGLAEALVDIIRHPEAHAERARAARAALDGAKGATARVADELLKLIPE